ncbi:MAG: ABC transporter permease [Chitinophagaceae bacterium]|nr:ABC transporter permease [Chitinophagaceae bacterium]
MFKNYFKTAWRNLRKNKLFSFINIIGLSLAIPFALLSLIQVQSAFESERFHPFPERTYRVITDVTDNVGAKTKYALSPNIAAEQLKENYPAIEKATFVVRDFEWALNNRIKTLDVNTIYVEPDFFDIFGFKIIAGSRPSEPNTLVITQEKAQAFFGTSDVVGKVLTHPTYGDFVVKGVLAPYKQNTHFRSDVMVSMATYKKFSKNTNFTSLNGFTYVLMRQNRSPKNLDAVLSSVATAINKQTAGEKSKEKLNFRAQPVTAIAPDFENLRGNPYVDSIFELAVNFSFALGLLLLAAFNYVNLTLARSLSRAKEVGVRKVTGALRYQLVIQFICESVLVALIALGGGYIILELLERFSYVNWFIWEVDNNVVLWISFLLFTILIGVIAGIIPARILSRFLPVKVLKGTIVPSGFGNMGLRNTLVVIQFVASSCFIFLIATLLTSEAYVSKQGCLDGVASSKVCVADKNFDKKTSTSRQPYFNQVANNYQVLGTSEMYSSSVTSFNQTVSPFSRPVMAT